MQLKLVWAVEKINGMWCQCLWMLTCETCRGLSQSFAQSTKGCCLPKDVPKRTAVFITPYFPLPPQIKQLFVRYAKRCHKIPPTCLGIQPKTSFMQPWKFQLRHRCIKKAHTAHVTGQCMKRWCWQQCICLKLADHTYCQNTLGPHSAHQWEMRIYLFNNTADLIQNHCRRYP